MPKTPHASFGLSSKSLLFIKKGGLKFIAQQDFGHNVGIDLINGTIFLDYDSVGLQNGTVEIHNPKQVIWICYDTLIAGDLFHLRQSEPNTEGWFDQKAIPLKWRPIWFTRWINGVPTKIIGAQSTLPKAHGSRNVKKMVMLFSDGRLGIY